MRSKVLVAVIVLASIVTIAWSSAAQRQRSGRVSYEYLVIDDPTWTVNFNESMKKLNELGSEGWELAGLSPSPNNATKLYLKRIKR